MEFKDGDTITVNGKPCRIEGGALVPVAKKGPLGGELVEVRSIKWDAGKLFYVLGHPSVMQPKNNEVKIYITSPNHSEAHEVICRPDLIVELIVEANIPPRPAFTPMTAVEAAKLPDIVGQWVAVQIDDSGANWIGGQGYTFVEQEKILLIEGVDLP